MFSSERIEKRFLMIATAITVLEIFFFFCIAYAIDAYGGSIWNILSDRGGNEYVTLAHSMIAEGRFVLTGDIPDTFRTPGYPALLAALFLLVSDSYFAITVLHAFLTGITAALIAYTAENIGLSRRASTVTAILYAVSAGTVYAVVTGQGSDVLYTTLHAAALAAILAAALSKRTNYATAVFVGILLASATLTRPIGLLGSLPFLFGLLIVPSRELVPDLRRRVLVPLVALLVFLACLLPWCIRNYIATGSFMFSSLPAYNFVYYNIPLFKSFWNDVSENTVRSEIIASFGNPHMNLLRNAPYADEMSTVMISFLKENAAPYLVFHSLKTIPFFVGSGLHNLHNALMSEVPNMRLSIFPTDNYNITSEILKNNWSSVFDILQKFWVVTLERLLWVVIFALAIASPFFARNSARRVLIVAVVIILSNAFLTSPVAQPRYRVPAEPFIWLAAAYSVHALTSRYILKR